ncbi:MAG: zinc ribbon domain-containing protein [Myxococcota bacterium]
MLPIVFITIAASMLLVGLGYLWASIRAAFSPESAFDLPTSEASQRRRLEEKKEALLANLKDLDFDHAGGKIDDADYAKLRNKLRREAKQVLRLLDADVAPYRDKAAELVKNHLGGSGTAYRGKTPADTVPVDEERDLHVVLPEGVDVPDAAKKAIGQFVKEHLEQERPDVLAAVDALITCTNCGTRNDPDAAFCKKCGASLAEQAAEAEADKSKADGADEQNEAGEANEAGESKVAEAAGEEAEA